MAQARLTDSQDGFEDPVPGRNGITARSVVLGLLTAAASAYYGIAGSMVLHVGSLVKSNFPVSLILVLTIWVTINIVIARVAPRSVLSRTEMMVIFAMAWIAGMMPGVGWTGYMTGALPAPHFFATPENRWADLFLDELPHWAFPEPVPEIVDRFYFGLRKGETLPWSGWLAPVGWWLVGSLAMVGVAFFVTTIFHRQWADAERLTYPLVSFPADLTEGIGRGRCIPMLFRSPLFWFGFAWTAGIICWNIITFWYPQVPRVTLFDSVNTKWMVVAQNFPRVYYRVLPLVIGLGYLCRLDLLFSFWFMGLLAVVKVGVMNRTGFTVGLAGQPSTGNEIVNLESHGAMTVLVVWSIWMARRHLAYVWKKTWEGGDAGEGPVSYRTAVAGLVICASFVCGFFMAVGLSFSLALGQMTLMFIAYFYGREIHGGNRVRIPRTRGRQGRMVAEVHHGHRDNGYPQPRGNGAFEQQYIFWRGPAADHSDVAPSSEGDGPPEIPPGMDWRDGFFGIRGQLPGMRGLYHLFLLYGVCAVSAVVDVMGGAARHIQRPGNVHR